MGALVIDSAAAALAALPLHRSHRKLFGWLLLHAAGVPTLVGAVVSEWGEDVEPSVRDFAARWPSRRLLIRSDAELETSRSPRGGYLASVNGLEDEMRPLLDAGRVLFLLEPVSPFDDLYSVNFQPDETWRHWRLEIVGAGFDASDLKRGDVTPHEEVRLTVIGSDIRLVERTVATPAAQAISRTLRLRKAATLLRCDVADVENELRRRGETMLLEEPSYRAMPEPLLRLAMRHAARIRPVLHAEKLDDRVTLSMSFVGQDARPVFWDLVWPGTKYPGHRNASRTPIPVAPGTSTRLAKFLSGVPASPGRYRGRARVIRSLSELAAVRPGEVVVASQAVPDLVVAFDRMGGFVTDHGGRFAHAAVVARELGIPAVVGTHSATTDIDDGSTVVVNGTAGTVEIVDL